MYWSLRVLQEYPRIAAVVAARFDELQVDEAQDTSELQLAAIRELSATGALRSLVLIGDIEQSIYSFQGASPQSCRALASERGLATIELHHNHRSSQRICNVAVHFCSRSEPDLAVGENADCPWSPEVFLYDPAHPEYAVRRYDERLAALGISPDDAAVLGRWNDLVDELNAQHALIQCEPRPLAVGRAAAVVQGTGTLTRRQIESVDRAFAYAAWGTTDLNQLESETRATLRRVSVAILAELPAVGGDLRDWIRTAVGIIGTHLPTLATPPKHTAGQAFRPNACQEGVSAATAFAPPPQSLKAQTVHDIKGDSRDAVLVVADRTRSRIRSAQSVLWSRPLRGELVPADEAEELRIVFVALTRARRYCALALPADTPLELINVFEAGGFARLRDVP
jgi:superfamily I DNA/RNA helicase